MFAQFRKAERHPVLQTTRQNQRTIHVVAEIEAHIVAGELQETHHLEQPLICSTPRPMNRSGAQCNPRHTGHGGSEPRSTPLCEDVMEQFHPAQ